MRVVVLLVGVKHFMRSPDWLQRDERDSASSVATYMSFAPPSRSTSVKCNLYLPQEARILGLTRHPIRQLRSTWIIFSGLVKHADHSSQTE